MTENKVEEKSSYKKSTKKIRKGSNLVVITDFPLDVKENNSRNQISIDMLDERNEFVEGKDYILDISEVDDEIVVIARAESPKMAVRYVSSRPTVVLEVPDYDFNKIEIKSSCGDIDYYHGVSAKNIKIMSTDGKVSGIFDCEDLWIRSLDGDVFCNTPAEKRKKKGGLIDIRTQSGSIRGTLYADTMSFFSLHSEVNVTIRNEGNAGVFCKTLSGNINIYAKGYKKNEIEKRTLSGKILNRRPKASRDAKNEVVGMVHSMSGTIFIT